MAQLRVDINDGLWRGELIPLRRQNVDFSGGVINVTSSIWRNVEGPTKTEASNKPAPVLAELKTWRDTMGYRADEQLLFPSIQKKGEQPLQPEMILSDISGLH
ncbi:hypothetical protein DYQ86_07270 [Acidobacteria bacterium AB60]|nr:hypothetical protein DYQ86_07270 [Acidobacteria bacterium AB60]